MSNLDINRFKKIQEEYNEAVATERELQAELKMLKKQATDILKEHGYTSFSDINKMKEKITGMEAEIEKAEQDMLEYIKYVNEKKQAKDSIIVG